MTRREVVLTKVSEPFRPSAWTWLRTGRTCCAPVGAFPTTALRHDQALVQVRVARSGLGDRQVLFPKSESQRLETIFTMSYPCRGRCDDGPPSSTMSPRTARSWRQSSAPAFCGTTMRLSKVLADGAASSASVPFFIPKIMANGNWPASRDSAAGCRHSATSLDVVGVRERRPTLGMALRTIRMVRADMSCPAARGGDDRTRPRRLLLVEGPCRRSTTIRNRVVAAVRQGPRWLRHVARSPPSCSINTSPRESAARRSCANCSLRSTDDAFHSTSRTRTADGPSRAIRIALKAAQSQPSASPTSTHTAPART